MAQNAAPSPVLPTRPVSPTYSPTSPETRTSTPIPMDRTSTEITYGLPTVGIEAQLKLLGIEVVAPNQTVLPRGWTTQHVLMPGGATMIYNENKAEVARWTEDREGNGANSKFVVHPEPQSQSKTGKKASAQGSGKKRPRKCQCTRQSVLPCLVCFNQKMDEERKKSGGMAAGKGAKKQKTEKVEGKRTRVVAPRVEVKLAAEDGALPKPWQTEPVSKLNFTITNMGKVENWHWRDWQDGRRGEPIAFPSTLSVRDTPKNMKVVAQIQALIAAGRTAKAFSVTERSGRKQVKKNIELWFGRTVQEDLAAVPELEERKRREEEERKMQEKQRAIRTKYFGSSRWGGDRQAGQAATVEGPIALAEMEREILSLLPTEDQAEWQQTKQRGIEGAIKAGLMQLTARWW
jgi:hypothetical protein